MDFFPELLRKHNLENYDGKPLWRYLLNKEEHHELQQSLRFSTPATIDPKNVTLYYAQWWKLFYDGGIPSKQEIFESVGGNIRFEFSKDEFYKLARVGAQMLGVKWIKKQNTLYFRTLLLQGGLPLKHISNNQGKYKAFLVAVLEEQPETIEDFMFKTDIVELLPKSSQNEVIYENCLEIVNSILNGDGTYDEFLKNESTLKDIFTALKIKKTTLPKRDRQNKPKKYWLLNLDNGNSQITLKLGFSETYTKDTLSAIFGFEATDRNYQFYIYDRLICVFRKLSNNKYKTNWYNQENIVWQPTLEIPNTYVLSNDIKYDLPDFLQHIPSVEEPTLWNRFSDSEWRLIKGSNAPHKDAAILFPNNWKYDLPANDFGLYDKQLLWMPFEGKTEITFNQNQETRIYLSGIKSFEWVIQSKKPNWMLMSNLPVTKGIPKVLVFDESGYDIKKNKFKVYVRKHKTNKTWEDIYSPRLIDYDYGCYDLKIEKDSVVAYDTFYNIGNLEAIFSKQTINSARVSFVHRDLFECRLNTSKFVEIVEINNGYQLSVNTEYSNIPTSIKASLGYPNKKKLYFDLQSPFQGMIITDREGQIIKEEQQISLADLYGMRILSTPDTQTFLTLKNTLKQDVVIKKEIKKVNQPIITYKDDIVRLFYLADAMDCRNIVTLELSEGRSNKKYKISGFSHSLDVDKQLEAKVSLYESNEELELFAVPVNCTANDIQDISLLYSTNVYTFPKTNITTKQFIIISSKNDGKQLMPRFVNTGDFFLGVDKKERIDNFHRELKLASFNDDIWKQVLKYFSICVKYDIPFSTFDQLRAISKSSEVASRTFIYLGINQTNCSDYIQKEILEMEKDLGFCFHWINKKDWDSAIKKTITYLQVEYKQHDKNVIDKFYKKISKLISLYLVENELQELSKYILQGNKISCERILQKHILELRAKLGERVLKELPCNIPIINDHYGIQIEEHPQVSLLIKSPIAVAESISGIENDSLPIWGGGEKREVIRRNIQYSQYLNPNFYNKIILHVLKSI